MLRVNSKPYDDAEAAYLLHPVWRGLPVVDGRVASIGAMGAGGCALLGAIATVAKRRRWCVGMSHGPLSRRWRRALAKSSGAQVAADSASVQLEVPHPVVDDSGGVKRRAGGQRSGEEVEAE